jgi:sugar/nucleoside kinase (ribokinase family)
MSIGTVDLALRGTVFLDIVMSGLSAEPEPGHEVWASGMDWVPGGVANTAVAALRLGLSVALDATCGNDQAGAICAKYLQAEGLDLSYLSPASSTAVTIAIEHGGDRAMITHEDRAASAPTGRPLPPARAVIGQARDERWWDSGPLVLIDANDDPTGRWDIAELAEQLSGADIFTPNRKEALAYTRTDDLQRAAQRLGELVPTVVITDGADGAVGFDANGFAVVPGVKVDAIDTTGAGDVFIVALAYARLAGWQLEQAIRFAVLCSGLSTERLGGSAGAPSWERLHSWLATADAKTRAAYVFLAGWGK